MVDRGMPPALAIAMGSALGGLARVQVTSVIATAPLATALVNVSGAFLIGLLHVLTLPGGRLPAPAWLRQCVLTGFLGGYTTFSILSVETLALLADGRYSAAAASFGGSLALALLAVVAGRTLARRLERA